MIVVSSRRRAVLFVEAAALLVALAAPAAVTHVSASYDKYQYLKYTKAYMLDGPALDSSRDRSWAQAHEGLVLAEGQHACAWLGQQQAVPRIDATGNATTDVVQRRYLATPAIKGVVLSPFGRSTIVAGAWAHLCSDTAESRTSPASRQDD